LLDLHQGNVDTPMKHSQTQSISPPSIDKSDSSLARMKRKHAMLQRVQSKNN